MLLAVRLQDTPQYEDLHKFAGLASQKSTGENECVMVAVSLTLHNFMLRNSPVKWSKCGTQTATLLVTPSLAWWHI